MDIQILDLVTLQKLAKRPFEKYTALISIGDAFAEPLRLDHWPEYFLELHFDDVWSSELEYETSGADAFRLFSGEQAAQIADFFRSHLEEIDTLICQCRSGRSRSAAVAAAVKEYFSHDGIEIFKDEQYSPNVYVFQKTLRALEEKFDGWATAWMIREDGTAIPCVQHIYGNPDCIEETLYAAEWLYKNTLHKETKRLVLRFLAAYADSLSPDGDPVRKLLDQIANQPYVTLTAGFIQEVGSALIKKEEDLRELNRQVCEKLNEEFLRARLGGMYITIEGNRDIYFRVSSERQNWEEMVRSFLAGYTEPLDKVTVIYDEESTGKSSEITAYNFRKGCNPDR